MEKFWDNFFTKITVNLIAIIFMLIGSNNNIGKYVYNAISLEKIDYNKFNLFVSLTGIVLVYAYYPIRYELLRKRMNIINSELIDLAKFLHKRFNVALGKQLKVYDLSLNVRKYKEEKKFRFFYQNRKDIYFKVLDLKFLNNSEPFKDIRFQVKPVPRGLVGVAYQRKRLVYDDKLTLDDRKKLYNLNTFLLENGVISRTDFAIAKPIIDKNDKVVEIVTFDTEQNVEIPIDKHKKKEVEDLIKIYSNMFSKILTLIKLQ